MAEATYVTSETLNTKIEIIKNDMTFEKGMTDIRFQSMEKLLNERLGKMEAIMEKNLAKYDAIASDIKGDVKAMNARLDTMQNKFSWNLAWVGIIMGLVLAIVQHFWK